MQFLTLLFVLTVSAQSYDFSKQSYCLGGCSTALNQVTFSTAPKSRSKGIPAACSNSLLLQSTYLCLDLYCSKSLNNSLALLVNPCKKANLTIVSYAATKKNYTSLDSVHQFKYGEYKKSDSVKTVVLPNAELYKRAYRTYAASNDSKAYDRSFGWGLAGFWALFLIVGVFIRVTSWLRYRFQPAQDREAGSTTVKRGVYIKTTSIIKKHLVLPALVGRHHVEPVAGFITVPTRIEGLTIFAYITLNILLMILGHDVFSAHLNNPSVRLQWTRYIADRAGILAISNMPMLWLFGGRNNFLQWISGYDFSTYNTLHRWIGRIVVVQAIIHSCCYSAYEGAKGMASYLAWFDEGLWTTCGVLAVTAMSLLIGASVLPLRKNFYEVFLRLHITFSMIGLVGGYIHVKGKKEYWPYLPFFYAAAAVWAFDHVVTWARIIVLNFREMIGKQKATVSYHADHDVLRITVPSSINFQPGPGAYYFLYFPSTWRGYESHPFTLAAWNQAPSNSNVEILSLDSSKRSSSEKLPEKTSVNVPVVDQTSSASETTSVNGPKRTTLTFLVRPYTGFTGTLRRRALAAPSNTFQKTVLLEGPYGHKHPVQRYKNVLLIAAGTGITALLPYVQFLLSERGIGAPRVATQKIHLIWSVKSAGFVDDVLEQELSYALSRSEITITVFITGKNEKDVVVFNKAVNACSGRMDVARVIEESVMNEYGSTAVACCGPAQVADIARSTVIRTLSQRDVEYFEECFSW